MRHIDHEKRAVFVCNFGKSFEINGPGICGRTGNEQLRAVPADHVLDLIVVDAARLRVHTVADAVIVFAGEIDAGTVRQMAAAGKIHAHERIARLQKRGVDRQICLRAGVRLHIGIGRAEQLFRAFNRNRFQYIYIITAAVIALSGVPFRIFVREDRSGSRKNRLRYEVFRRDKLYPVVLPLIFRKDRLTDLRVA